MGTDIALPAGLSEQVRIHLENVAGNLQLVSDLGYGDTALAVVLPDGALAVVADARPSTAVAAFPTSREGRTLSHQDEPEAYEALARGEIVLGARKRTSRGISFSTSAHPVGPEGETHAVLLRDLGIAVLEAPGRMEVAFMQIAEEILGVLRRGPLLDPESRPFTARRLAGDGVMRVDERGAVTYASPNAVNIMRGAGVEGTIVGVLVSTLPGALTAVIPALQSRKCVELAVEVRERVLRYRTLALEEGAVVLVEDVTEQRRREQELKVKEATIREVHHRVKNNLQTIASLLRIQARRTGSEDAAHALREAVERISSMAVVHEMLAHSAEERVDFRAIAETVVDMVRQGLVAPGQDVEVRVEGSTGHLPAPVATPLALVTAELVHNAIEHGLAGRERGEVVVSMRRLPGEVHLSVRDNGQGLPERFSVDSSANLGLAIVKTVVTDDLRGTLDFGVGRGTTVTIRVPLTDVEATRGEG